MIDILITVLSILFSGITATVITILYQRLSEETKAKRAIFQTAVAYRYAIAEEENVRSLNSIEVVFHKNADVRKAWKAYMDEADKSPSNPQNINDKYIRLLEEMATACGYKKIKWDDLKKYYYPTGLLNRKTDDEVLKKLQIQTAEKALSEVSPSQNTPQKEQFERQLALELLPKLIENPNALEKLIDLGKTKK